MSDLQGDPTQTAVRVLLQLFEEDSISDIHITRDGKIAVRQSGEIAFLKESPFLDAEMAQRVMNEVILPLGGTVPRIGGIGLKDWDAQADFPRSQDDGSKPWVRTRMNSSWSDVSQSATIVIRVLR